MIPLAPPPVPRSQDQDAPLFRPGTNDRTISEIITDVPLKRPMPTAWWVTFLVSFAIVMLLMVSVAWLFIRGVGIWGINIPVAWGFAITNFVWWIGIGHAGTFISAILLLLHQEWRTSINRFSEAMTLFAVACAAMFPLLHLGRPQFFYWMLPYPDSMGLWPQFRSPLIWDIFAVTTYGIVSLVFWYVGLVPDLGTTRDRAKSKFKRWFYGVVSLGWRGDIHHWHDHGRLYVVLAALATPLVLSVHSIVGMDFASAQLPGWHSTIFPPYFVGGAIFSGFAMVLTLVIPVRALFPRMHQVITTRHLDFMAKVTLATGWVVTYGYFAEIFTAWYSNNVFERYMMYNRAFGPYWFEFWFMMLLCNVGVPQLLWWRRMRQSPLPLFIISILVNVGMWTERYVIVITSLHRDFLPSSWGLFHPTFWDYSTFIGTLGLFFALMFLFLRFVPAISMSEVRHLVYETKKKSGGKEDRRS